MGLDRSEAPAGFEIPEANGVVVAGTDEDFTVRSDDERTNPSAVAFERPVLDPLRHFEELSNTDVAKILGLQKSAASNRYVRALARLKQIMTAMSPSAGASR